jgi:lipoprotein NlpI
VRVSLALALALLAVAGTAAAGSAPTPLLDYARGLSFVTLPDEQANRRVLASITHELADDPPPERDCARTLGAGRFTGLLTRLASARATLGDSPGAVVAYRSALGCSPRAVYLYAALAEELMDAGRFAEARQTVLRGLALDRNYAALATVLGRLDFIEENWDEAIAWLRWSAAAEVDERQAAYWECFLWLAERRAGVARPRLVERALSDVWPKALLDSLRGELDEAGLLERLRAQPDTQRREALVEALYYRGEQYLADHDVATARRYFAQAVNLKVPSFIEHHLALAELAKLQR